MQIRPSHDDDLQVIQSFDHVCVSEPERLDHISNAIAHSTCWSITLAAQVIGYLIIDKSFYGKPFLSLIYIAEQHRGLGLGRAALHWVKVHIGEPFFTSTNLSNARMIHLLRSEQFQDSGVIYNLDPGDPEIIFHYTPN